MNKIERQMVEILHKGRDEYGYVSVKAEFEAEGTRIDELLRLLEIANRADLELTVKIGGCEAIRDLLESKQIGARYVVAPMVETPYALRKYIDARYRMFNEDDALDTDFLFNMETITAYENREAIIELAASSRGVDGVVFGRGDFSGSMGLGSNGIERPETTDRVLAVSQLCKAKGLDFVVGGAISINSLVNLRAFRASYLTRFETRKVVFDAAVLESKDIDQGLLNAVHFELLWLINKREYYGAIRCEDTKRIETLEGRWHLLNE